ncbi:MAG TPA: XdhC/CoxI family protein [Bryobacteraceae bacterium]|nr:XdhC/CoxI family protein [Bryobacteraceae bacterium]
MDIYSEIVRLRRAGEKCALATIVSARGSIPAYESAKMLIRENGSIFGTVGGGCVEAQVLTVAREVIETGRPKTLSFDLSGRDLEESGLICGGELEIFIEAVLPQPTAIIFGAGHISKGLSKIASLAGFAVTVVDDRASFASRERFPEAEEVHAAEYESVFPQLPVNESSYLIIVTRGHKDDLRVLRLAAASAARYVAMIGSKKKVIEILRDLEKEGVPKASLERVHAPMGLDIGAVTPEEIAVSVVAEMIALRRNARSGWRQLCMSLHSRVGKGAEAK